MSSDLIFSPKPKPNIVIPGYDVPIEDLINNSSKNNSLNYDLEEIIAIKKKEKQAEKQAEKKDNKKKTVKKIPIKIPKRMVEQILKENHLDFHRFYNFEVILTPK